MRRISITFTLVLIPAQLIAMTLSGLLINHAGLDELTGAITAYLVPQILSAWVAGRRDGRHFGQFRSSGSCWLATLAMTGVWLFIILALIVSFAAVFLLDTPVDRATVGSSVTTEFLFLGLEMFILAIPAFLIIRIAFGLAHTRAVKAVHRKLLETF